MPSADELVQSCTSIFTLPDMYFRVRDVVDDPKSTTDDLVNAIKFDPAIAARLLRIVNSPLYGFPQQIDTLTRAVTLLGMQAVNDLVMATTVGRTFSGMTMQLMDMPMFWQKSVLCALLGGRIAKSCGIDDSERFFIEGLLRDIGHVVLYQTVPQRAQSALVEAGYLGAALAEVEQASIGCDFAEVGAELIRSWGMPAQIEQAIRYQLRPSEAGEFALHASIVHLAGVVADHEDLAPKGRQEGWPFEPHAVTTTGFAPAHLPNVLFEARAQLQDTLTLIYPQALAA
ncbi:MAG: HDOD domain-containing protein [Nitrospira sp.]|nr:HDOD domain-containing protein [Nitrospira sp.]